MPLFGPLEGSEGAFLIPFADPRPRLGSGQGQGEIGPQIAPVALSGVLRPGLPNIRLGIGDRPEAGEWGLPPHSLWR
jgi:hypothetical protein